MKDFVKDGHNAIQKTNSISFNLISIKNLKKGIFQLVNLKYVDVKMDFPLCQGLIEIKF